MEKILSINIARDKDAKTHLYIAAIVEHPIVVYGASVTETLHNLADAVENHLVTLKKYGEEKDFER